MIIDLSLILRKQVTLPLLCYILYQLYKDLVSKEPKSVETEIIAEDTPSEAPSTPEPVDNAVYQEKRWQPVDYMRNLKPSEQEKNYTPWSTTNPFPYQPFKPGEYRLTMGVKSIPLEHWFMFENTLKSRIEKKWEIIKEAYKDVMYHLDPAMVNCDTYYNSDYTDEVLVTAKDVEIADAAVCEWYNSVVSYLVTRFPQYFQVVLSPDDETPGVLHNSIMDEYHPVNAEKYLQLGNTDVPFLKYYCFNVDIIPAELTNPKNLRDKVGRIPLETTEKTRRAHELILSVQRMVEEDLILLSPNANKQFDGEYILMSGCFAFAAGFNPRERFLKPLTQIHGPVPEYKIKLQSQMNKFFQTHKPQKLVMRINFSFQTHSKLYVTDDNKGIATEEIRAKTLDELHGGHDLHYRSERQCLIKFENTQAMCFSIKTYLWNLQDEFLPNDYYSQEGVIQDLCEAVKGMQYTIGQYKRRPEWGPALLEMLEPKLNSKV